MSVKPILFNTDMVCAILGGKKTVTRRIMRPQPLFKTHRKFVFDKDVCPKKWKDCSDITKICMYQPGDILYVRETWSEWTDGYIYKAWTELFPQAGQYKTTKWHPSIHMPMEAARIWLKVTEVRVERLQDITEEQAQAEGCMSGMLTGPCAARQQFEEIWDSTIKKSDLDSYGWEANPWVWVISFERCEKPEGSNENETN